VPPRLRWNTQQAILCAFVSWMHSPPPSPDQNSPPVTCVGSDLPPTSIYRLCSFQLATRSRLPFGWYEITLMAGSPFKSLTLKLSVHIKSQIHSVIFSYLFLNHFPSPPASLSSFLGCRCHETQNNSRAEGRFSMASANPPKLTQRMKSVPGPWDSPTSP
jgi:hypothetical protein